MKEQVYRQEGRSAALPADLKLENRQKVLEAFRYGGEHTVGEVSALTGISRLTVMRAVQFFVSKGTLRSMGLGESSNMGGKKPERFAFADQRLMLCVALWPMSTRLSLHTITGEPVAQADYASNLHRPLAAVFDDLKIHIGRFLSGQNRSLDCLYGVMLSTAGTVDSETGLLRFSVHSPEWGEQIPVGEYLKEIVGQTPVVLVENAGKTAGRAVLIGSDSHREGRVLTVFTAWGISACLIEDGRILNGPLSLVGEIGHMSIDCRDDELCACGRRGCLERLVSRERMIRLLEEKPAPEGSALAGAGQSLELEQVFAAARAGDARAMELTDLLARRYADALHNVAVVYNPDSVIFQGTVGHACEYFDQRLRTYMKDFRYFPEGRAFRVGYDPTDLLTLNASGGWHMLNEHYFRDPQLYMDDYNVR